MTQGREPTYSFALRSNSSLTGHAWQGRAAWVWSQFVGVTTRVVACPAAAGAETQRRAGWHTHRCGQLQREPHHAGGHVSGEALHEAALHNISTKVGVHYPPQLPVHLTLRTRSISRHRRSRGGNARGAPVRVAV